MKNKLRNLNWIVSLCFVFSLSSPSQQFVKGVRTSLGYSREIAVIVQFASEPTKNMSAQNFWLDNGNDEKVYCSSVYDTSTSRYVRFIFGINSSNFAVFEKLVTDSSSYTIHNDESMAFASDTIEIGGLDEILKNKLPRISEKVWNRYVVNEYSSQFLFPHQFNFGTRLGLQDSTKTVYFLELVQSGSWIDGSALPLFWGLKGRWSTDPSDKLNYVQFYPLTVLLTQGNLKSALTSGVETGYQGFGKFGRVTGRGELQFRLPFNPVDLTLGSPRWRINPVINIAAQAALAWSNTSLPDSVKESYDLSVGVRYDIPIAKTYYLQTKAKGIYSTMKRELQYQYELSLGYIANGDVRVMAMYREGYQEVTYQFDRQMLLGFAFDILNLNQSK